jgi:hypothetical protein
VAMGYVKNYMCKEFLSHLEENAHAWHFFEIPNIECTWLKLSFM